MWLVLLGGVAALASTSYRWGRTVAADEVSNLNYEAAKLRTALNKSEQRNAQLEVSNQSLARERDGWRQRYGKEVPTGAGKDVWALVQQQLSNGVPIDRLRMMIGAAGRAQTCDDNPTTKRFVVRTPIYKGANEAVTFGNGTITVTASGQPATDSAGRPEAWFDPAKPVSIVYAELGGGETRDAGPLPLHHAMIVGQHEYRFSVVDAKTRGFVEITADRCALPTSTP